MEAPDGTAASTPKRTVSQPPPRSAGMLTRSQSRQAQANSKTPSSASLQAASVPASGASGGRPPRPIRSGSRGVASGNRRNVADSTPTPSNPVSSRPQRSSTTKQVSSSKKKAVPTRAHNRKTPSRSDCRLIYGRLLAKEDDGTKDRTGTLTLSTGGKAKLEKYQRAPEPHLELPIHESLLYCGRPCFPVDHPRHHEVLKDCAMSLLPPEADIYLRNTDARLTYMFRSRIQSKYDVDAVNLKDFFEKYVKDMIEDGRKKAAQPVSSAPLETVESGSPAPAPDVASNDRFQDSLTRFVDVTGDAIGSLAGETKAVAGKVGSLADDLQQTQGIVQQTQDQLQQFAGKVGSLVDETKAVAGLARKVDARVDGVEHRVDGFEVRVDRVEDDMSSTKAQIESLNETVAVVLSSNAKAWRTLEAREARENYDEGAEAVGGCILFGSPGMESEASSDQLELALDDVTKECNDQLELALDDVTKECNDFLWNRVEELLGDPFDRQQLSAFHRRCLNEFEANLRGKDIEQMKSAFNEVEFSVLESNPADLARLPSLGTFLEGLREVGEKILVIDNEDESKVFVLTHEATQIPHIDDILPAVGGVDVQFLATTHQDEQFYVYYPDTEAASPTVGALLRALLQLAAKTTQRLQLESGWFDIGRTPPSFDLPVQIDELVGFDSVRLELLRFILTPEQQTGLVRRVDSVKFENCSFSDGGNALVDAIVSDSRQVKCIEWNKRLAIEEEPLLRLVRWLGKALPSAFKVKFTHEMAGVAWKNLPNRVRQEFSGQIANAMANGDKVTHLEVDCRDALQEPFNSLLQSAVKNALEMVGTHRHDVFKMVGDGLLPIVVFNSSRRKLSKLIDNVKQWAEESATTSDETSSSAQKRSPSTAALSAESPTKQPRLE